MKTVKVRVSRDDFRQSVKACKLNGHSTCRCVMAKAIERATGVDIITMGYSSGRFMNQQVFDGPREMSNVVQLFDDKYERVSADNLYEMARTQGTLNFDIQIYN